MLANDEVLARLCSWPSVSTRDTLLGTGAPNPNPNPHPNPHPNPDPNPNPNPNPNQARDWDPNVVCVSFNEKV